MPKELASNPFFSGTSLALKVFAETGSEQVKNMCPNNTKISVFYRLRGNKGKNDCFHDFDIVKRLD